MGDVIKVNFGSDDETGYLFDESDNITGIYARDIVAGKTEDGVYIGKHKDHTVEDAAFLTLDEMNRFCVMWLCIFQPESVRFDDE